MEGTAQRAGFLGYYFFFIAHSILFTLVCMIIKTYPSLWGHTTQSVLCTTNWYWFILRTISAMLRLFQHFLFRCYLPKCAWIFFCIFEIQRKFHGNLNIPKCSFFRPKYNRNEKFFSQKVFIRNSISSYLQSDLCTRLKTKKELFCAWQKILQLILKSHSPLSSADYEHFSLEFGQKEMNDSE